MIVCVVFLPMEVQRSPKGCRVEAARLIRKVGRFAGVEGFK